MKSLLLINPPVMRPCEPPAGPFRLSLALMGAGIPHDALDLNLGGQLWMMEKGSGLGGGGRWSARARKNCRSNLGLLRSAEAAGNFDRYSKAVGELDRLLSDASPEGYEVSLANFKNDLLSPLKSRDLIRAAEEFQKSPFFDFFSGRIADAIEDGGHAVAGVSITYLGQALTAFAVIGFLRSRFPHIRIVAGGGLVSSWMASHDLSSFFGGLVDTFVRGPGEVPLLEMCGDDPESCSSLCHEVPHLWRPGEYLSPSPVLPFSVSTGCHWGGCRFCPERAEGNVYEPAGTGAALGHLKILIGKLKPGLVHITDNAISPSFLRALASDPPGASWYGFARVSEELADEGFCRALKKSGCAMIKLGIESGSDRVLEQMNKGFSSSLSSRVLRAMRNAGIPTYVYMLFGTPWESRSDAEVSLDFCAGHSDCIGFLNLALFNLPSHGPDTEGLSTRRFYDADLGLYVDFDHPKEWDRRSVRSFIEREFSRHPAIAQIVRRDPPVFTSSHAPFFKHVS